MCIILIGHSIAKKFLFISVRNWPTWNFVLPSSNFDLNASSEDLMMISTKRKISNWGPVTCPLATWQTFWPLEVMFQMNIWDCEPLTSIFCLDKKSSPNNVWQKIRIRVGYISIDQHMYIPRYTIYAVFSYQETFLFSDFYAVPGLILFCFSDSTSFEFLPFYLFLLLFFKILAY